MEMLNMNFTEFDFNISQSSAITMLTKQIKKKDAEASQDLKISLHQIDMQVGAKMEECSQIVEEIRNLRLEHFKVQMEFEVLKREEEELSSTQQDLKEGLKHANYLSR